MLFYFDGIAAAFDPANIRHINIFLQIFSNKNILIFEIFIHYNTQIPTFIYNFAT